MDNQFETMLKLQMAMYQGWAKLMQDSMLSYQRLWEQQAKLFQHPSYFRFHDIVPMGASLLDHYGKRSHDVDVERV